MGCDGGTTCGDRMRALDVPDNAGLRFTFTKTTDGRSLDWERSSFAGSHGSLNYLALGMSSTEMQVTVDIAAGGYGLRKVDGTYLKQRDGTFAKLYSYYGGTGKPRMLFSNGVWQVFADSDSQWCIQQPGSSDQPPSGQWEIHARFLQKVAEPTLARGQEWICEFQGMEQILRVDDLKSSWSGSLCSLTGVSLTTGTSFNLDSSINWIRRNTVCTVKVTKAVGCGKAITWSQMECVDEKTVQALGFATSIENFGQNVVDAAHVGLHKRDDMLEGDDRVSAAQSSHEQWEEDGWQEYEYSL